MRFAAISVAELWKLKDDPQIYIVDLRSREDFQVFHLRNAHCYPYDEIEHWEHKLPKNRKILLCCEYGNTSMYAAKKTDAAGISDIYSDWRPKCTKWIEKNIDSVI